MGETFRRGRTDCYQDRCENVPFASIGGLDNRNTPTVPKYINSADSQEWLSGYLSMAVVLYGVDWKTITFEWKHALTIDADKPTAA